MDDVDRVGLTILLGLVKEPAILTKMTFPSAFLTLFNITLRFELPTVTSNFIWI